jgi:hypothetical protein
MISSVGHRHSQATNRTKAKKLIWSGYRQNIHSKKKSAGNLKRPIICRAICNVYGTDALKYSRNGIVPLRMKFAQRASKKKMEYLVGDLESTGQPAVTEAAEAAPLWEQLKTPEQ